MSQDLRELILQSTRLQWPPLVPELRLYLADMPLLLRPLVQSLPQPASGPYWAFAWVGGQALARYLFDHPQEVAGKRVLDFGSGSGICAIVAMKCGAASVLAADIDPVSEVAVQLNAGVNDTAIDFTGRDLLHTDPPDVDVILAGDTYYEEVMGPHVFGWLESANRRGRRVLIGDPFRTSFPDARLTRLAAYYVPTPRTSEGVEGRNVAVYTFPA